MILNEIDKKVVEALKTNDKKNFYKYIESCSKFRSVLYNDYLIWVIGEHELIEYLVCNPIGERDKNNFNIIINEKLDFIILYLSLKNNIKVDLASEEIYYEAVNKLIITKTFLEHKYIREILLDYLKLIPIFKDMYNYTYLFMAMTSPIILMDSTDTIDDYHFKVIEFFIKNKFMLDKNLTNLSGYEYHYGVVKKKLRKDKLLKIFKEI
jgi:hypothetical protein